MEWMDIKPAIFLVDGIKLTSGEKTRMKNKGQIHNSQPVGRGLYASLTHLAVHFSSLSTGGFKLTEET